MSAALGRLRRHFGDELLEREGRGYRLTVLGEQLLPAVREALRQLELTLQRSPRFDPADSDRSFPSRPPITRSSVLADPLLRLVKQAAPRIRLQLALAAARPGDGVEVLAMYDVLIGPVGFDFPGRHTSLPRPPGLRGRPGRERAGHE